MKQSKKYIVVDTWNGEGYSSDNGTEIKVFDNKGEAEIYCKLMAYRNEDGDVDISSVKNGYEYEDTHDDDSGSYRYYPLPKDAYAVEILCNINEVRILNQIEFSKAIADREAEIVEAELDRDDIAESTDDGIFYHSTDMYDYQYRRLENVYCSRV